MGAVAQHSHSADPYLPHTAALTVVTYSNAHDAYWVTRAAIQSADPVMLLEPKKHYFVRGQVDFDSPLNNSYATVEARSGTDATLLAWGPQIGRASCRERGEVSGAE